MEQDGEPVDWAAEAERLTAEFFDALQRMYIRAGEPALRTVAARNNRLSASNLSALFSGSRTALPNYEVLTAVVSALLHEAPAAEKERELEQWRDRWADARYARKQAQKSPAQKVDQLSQAAHVVEKAQADAELILAEARATAEDLVKQGRVQAEQVLSEAHMDAAALRAEAQLSLSAARINVENMLDAAQSESERIRAEAAASVEAARLDAGNIRGDARMEARRMLDAATREAHKVVATAEQIQADAMREAEEVKDRKQEIMAEMDRVHGVLNSLSTSSRPASPSPVPRALTAADEIAELERQETRHDPYARLINERIEKMLQRESPPGFEIEIV